MPRQFGPKSNFRCKLLILNRITALSRFAEPFQNLSNHFKIVGRRCAADTTPSVRSPVSTITDCGRRQPSGSPASAHCWQWKWGGPNHGKREGRARDSGILVHGVGEDGAHDGIWLQSIESQVIEGGTGDFIMVNGRERPTMTAKVREFNGQFYWDENGTPKTLERGRFDWFGRDPNWKDQLGYRGPKDIEKPVGEWNRQEVVADHDTLTNIVNGVVVNKGYRVYPTAGKIQLQSEAAEIYFRRVEMIPVENTK